MQKYYISICIPAYNSAAFIAETIQSVIRQTYTNWEIIVVEDGTDDGTKEIIEGIGREITQQVRYIRNQQNKGNSETRNYAISLANGNWIALLDSDDLWTPDHLQTLVETADENPGYDFIHSSVKVFEDDVKNVIYEQNLSDEVINNFPVSLYDRSYGIHTSSIMVSKKLMHSTGAFKSNLNYAEDVELWLRSARMGFKFAFTGKHTCFYRKHATGMTKNNQKMVLGTAEVYELYVDWEVIPINLRKKQTAEIWYAVAKMTRSNNKAMAKSALKKSMHYQYSIKTLLFWLYLLIK